MTLRRVDGTARAVSGPDPYTWIRAFNRLEIAITRHRDAKEGTGFADDADEELWRTWRTTLSQAGPPPDDRIGALEAVVERLEGELRRAEEDARKYRRRASSARARVSREEGVDG